MSYPRTYVTRVRVEPKSCDQCRQSATLKTIGQWRSLRKGGGPLRVTPFWSDTITPLICGEDLVFSFCLVSNLICNENPAILRRRTFFLRSSPVFGSKIPYFYGEDLFFGLHQFLDRKRMIPRNPAPGATILSNATAISHAAVWQNINLIVKVNIEGQV